MTVCVLLSSCCLCFNLAPERARRNTNAHARFAPSQRAVIYGCRIRESSAMVGYVLIEWDVDKSLSVVPISQLQLAVNKPTVKE